MHDQAARQEHNWIEGYIKDSHGFGMIFGTERTCTKCGAYQIASHCEGRFGGPWRTKGGKATTAHEQRFCGEPANRA